MTAAPCQATLLIIGMYDAASSITHQDLFDKLHATTPSETVRPPESPKIAAWYTSVCGNQADGIRYLLPVHI